MRKIPEAFKAKQFKPGVAKVETPKIKTPVGSKLGVASAKAAATPEWNPEDGQTNPGGKSGHMNY